MSKLECSKCGASVEAACSCHAPYLPAGARAAKAVAANPHKSDRAIAKELGVNQSTVSRVRKKSTDAFASVAKRTGLDGKARRNPKPNVKPKQDAAVKLNDGKESFQICTRNTKADWLTFKQLCEKNGFSPTQRIGELIEEEIAHIKPRPNKVATPATAPIYSGGHSKYLKPHEVDPEFTGTPTEFKDKYGHVQTMTAQQFATMRFSDWVEYFRSLEKYARKMPALPEREVDLNWLRAPKSGDVIKGTEALEYLEPLLIKFKAMLARASEALKVKA